MKKTIFIMAIPLFLTFCDGSGQLPIHDGLFLKSLMPLQAENTWIYEVEGNDYYTQITYTVDSVYTISYDGAPIEMYEILADYGIGYYTYTYFYNAGALKQTLYWKVEPENPTYCYKYPVVTGSRWTNEYLLFGEVNYSDRYSLRSKDTLIEVPAGTFRCYDYQIDRTSVTTSSTENHYFKPGTGLIAVKVTQVDTDNPENIIETWRLKLVYHDVD